MDIFLIFVLVLWLIMHSEIEVYIHEITLESYKVKQLGDDTWTNMINWDVVWEAGKF